MIHMELQLMVKDCTEMTHSNNSIYIEHSRHQFNSKLSIMIKKNNREEILIKEHTMALVH